MIPQSAGAALRWMEVLVALAVLQGTAELLLRRRVFADDGTWSWPTLAPELGWLWPVLGYRPFVALLALRMLGALLLLGGVRGAVVPFFWI